jgi:hypothetical protein
MAIRFDILRDGRDYWATADGGPRFFVGRRVSYEGRVGLYNVFPGSPLTKVDFDPKNYIGQFGFWVAFINPTAGCEGRNFLTINSYDRAGYTFGFGQFAAHVPDGDFVRWFRAVLALPEAAVHFPELSLVSGRIHGTAGPLETASSTAALMAYFNPSQDKVDDAEVLAAARVIYWTANHRPARLAQIAQMIASFRGYMARADRRGLIDGHRAALCCVIADLLHHGRGGHNVWSSVSQALASNDPFEALIAIGGTQWAERKATLRRLILADPQMQARRWSTVAGDFV